MFALIWVILLFADKVAGSGTGTPNNSSHVSTNSSAAVQSTVTTHATSTNVSTTTQETKTCSSSASGVVPRILHTSKCEHQSENLTCTCVSEGFPLPTIKWPRLENHTKYSVTANVCSCTVTSTITVSLKHFHNTTIECVSDNSIGAANLSITTKSQEKNIWNTLLEIVQEPKVYISALAGFVVGIILSSIVHCSVTKSCRKKQKTSENLSENLEMVITEAVPMMDADQAAAYDGIHEPEAVEGEAQSDGQSAPDGDLAQKEVEYSDINFSAIKNRNPEEAEKKQDATDTEYAEIKREEKRQENSQEDSEMLEGNEEKELITGEDNDAKKAEEEGGEDVALYSSVDEIMD